MRVVDARVMRDLGQVAHQQGQVVFVVNAADAAQLVDRRLVVQTAYQRIRGIGRQRDDAAAADDLRRLLDQADLGVLGVDLEILAHLDSLILVVGRIDGSVVHPTGIIYV